MTLHRFPNRAFVRRDDCRRGEFFRWTRTLRHHIQFDSAEAAHNFSPAARKSWRAQTIAALGFYLRAQAVGIAFGEFRLWNVSVRAFGLLTRPLATGPSAPK